MNVQLEGKSPAAITRAAKRLARKRVAREQRAEAKKLAAESIPFSGHETDAPPSWDKLLASAVTRPMIGWPWQKPWGLELPMHLLLPMTAYFLSTLKENQRAKTA